MFSLQVLKLTMNAENNGNGGTCPKMAIVETTGLR